MKKTLELKDLKCRADIYKLKIKRPSRKQLMAKALNNIYNDNNIPKDFRYNIETNK